MWKCIGRSGECQIQFIKNSINRLPKMMFISVEYGNGRPELQVFGDVWHLYRRWD